MSQQILEHVAKKHLKNTPDIKAGYTVRVHQRIKEGEKERVQIFEGLVIKVQGSGITKTMTVRKVVSGVGVEKIFPIHSDNIVKVEIKKMGKVRRAKLYYMRERSGKSARLKEQHVDIAVDIEHLHKDEPIAAEEPSTENEAPTAEETTPVEAEAPTEEKAEETPAAEEPATEEAKAEESEAKAE